MRYRYEMLRKLRQFFEWLSQQPGYKSKINATEVAYLSLSRVETRVALEASKRKKPTLSEVIKVVESIDVQNEEDQRDRAMICYTLLTGARISAIYSLPIKAFDLSQLVVYQDPKLGVKTKASKRIVTTLFPIDYEPAFKHFLDWYRYLKEEKGFGEDDPVFPQAVVINGEENISFYNTHDIQKKFWSSSVSVRKVFQKRFIDAEVPYYHPHTFRHLVVAELSKLPLTEEEKRAISQGLGHEHVSTTFDSNGYGHIEEERQIEIVKNIKLAGRQIKGSWPLDKADAETLAKALKIIKDMERP